MELLDTGNVCHIKSRDREFMQKSENHKESIISGHRVQRVGGEG